MSKPNAAVEPTPAPAPEATPTPALITEDAPTVEPTSLLSEGGEPTPPAAEGEGEPAPTDPPAAVEPLTAESFTLPEGIEVAPEQFDSALEIINNTELTPSEVGKQLIDLQLKMMQDAGAEAETASNAAWDEMQTTWQTEAKALPTIGGEALPATLATIKAGLKRAGATKETFEALSLTGAGNHPEVIRVLHALTLPLAEGTPTRGSVESPNLTAAQKLYPNLK